MNEFEQRRAFHREGWKSSPWRALVLFFLENQGALLPGHFSGVH